MPGDTATTLTKKDLESITDATMRDGDGHVLKAILNVLPGIIERGDMVALVDHLGWLLQGKVDETQMLRRNIFDLCPLDLAAKIVQD